MRWWQVVLAAGSREYTFRVRAADAAGALHEAARLGDLGVASIGYAHISELSSAPTPAWTGRLTRGR